MWRPEPSDASGRDFVVVGDCDAPRGEAWYVLDAARLGDETKNYFSRLASFHDCVGHVSNTHNCERFKSTTCASSVTLVIYSVAGFPVEATRRPVFS